MISEPRSIYPVICTTHFDRVVSKPWLWELSYVNIRHVNFSVGFIDPTRLIIGRWGVGGRTRRPYTPQVYQSIRSLHSCVLSPQLCALSTVVCSLHSCVLYLWDQEEGSPKGNGLCNRRVHNSVRLSRHKKFKVETRWNIRVMRFSHVVIFRKFFLLHSFFRCVTQKLGFEDLFFKRKLFFSRNRTAIFFGSEVGCPQDSKRFTEIDRALQEEIYWWQ